MMFVSELLLLKNISIEILAKLYSNNAELDCCNCYEPIIHAIKNLTNDDFKNLKKHSKQEYRIVIICFIIESLAKIQSSGHKCNSLERLFFDIYSADISGLGKWLKTHFALYF